MSGISIGAVGAAVIAGLISVIGLIIGKEQKISEFRQAWINDLRRCLIDYLTNINAACDLMRLKRAGRDIDEERLVECYRKLNEANHGISLRVNASEVPAKKLLDSMEKFEKLAAPDGDLTPENIKVIEESYLQDSKNLLKFEWDRVKKGEPIFVAAKRISLFATFSLILLLIAFWVLGGEETTSPEVPKWFQLYPAISSR